MNEEPVYIHIAGIPVGSARKRIMRQRCGWCGKLMLEVQQPEHENVHPITTMLPPGEFIVYIDGAPYVWTGEEPPENRCIELEDMMTS